jgi:hypothetical protein
MQNGCGKVNRRGTLGPFRALTIECTGAVLQLPFGMADSTSIADDVAKLSLADAAPEEQQPKQKTSKKKKKSKPADVPDTPSEQDDTNYEADLSPEERKVRSRLPRVGSPLQATQPHPHAKLKKHECRFLKSYYQRHRSCKAASASILTAKTY